MKQSVCYLLFFVILSCNKNISVTEVPPLQNAKDSAKLILVTTKDVITNEGFITAYGPNMDKKWELSNNGWHNTFKIGSYINNSLIVTYLGNTELQSLNIANGSQNWSNKEFIDKLTYGFFVSRHFNHDTIVVATSTLSGNKFTERNALILLNKQDGSELCRIQVDAQPLAAPLLDGNSIYYIATNSNGTKQTLTAYNIVTKKLLWQKNQFSFLLGLPGGILVKNDTLIFGAGTGNIDLINKNDGSLYWSKGFNTKSVFSYKDKFIFNDNVSGRLTILSSKTGEVILQGPPIPYTRANGAAYIYNDDFYNNAYDTLYCSSLLDGSLKWSKQITNAVKFINVGDKVYYLTG
ncbi:MAG: PQQ-binding-like beta-propeller repeat protein, partial [Ginsengibacter sp.]